MWTDNATNFKTFNPSPKAIALSVAGTTKESVFHCLKAGSAFSPPHQQNVSNMKLSLIDSNILTKSVPDKKLWLCQLWGHLPYWKSLKLQEPFFSVKIRKDKRRGANQSHVTEGHPKPTKTQSAQRRAHEKEPRILFLEWLFELAHAADRKWRAYLFRED